MTAMNSNWNRHTHPIHLTGMSLRKSTLQKVTKRIRNMKKGKMVLKMGRKKAAADAKAGV